jgi:hypothetical protein
MIQPLGWTSPIHYRPFTIILRHATLGRTVLDLCSARNKDLYLKTHNAHKRQTTMRPTGFEPAIPSIERAQIHALDGVAIGVGFRNTYYLI